MRILRAVVLFITNHNFLEIVYYICVDFVVSRFLFVPERLIFVQLGLS
jgi:hypothetical protein